MRKSRKTKHKGVGQGVGGGGPKGNKHGLGIKDPAVRQMAYLSYCEHIAKGIHKKAWFFNDGKGSRCTQETMEKYILDKVEFDPLKKDEAEAKGFRFWIDIITASAQGLNTKANTATLQMYMRNKYAWDKSDNRNIEVNADTKRKFDQLMEQLTSLQQQNVKAQ